MTAFEGIEPPFWAEPDDDLNTCEECSKSIANDDEAVDNMCGHCADEAYNKFEDPEEE